MKKWFAILLAIVMLLPLCACGTKDAQETTEQTVGAMKAFTVTIVYADGSSKDFQYESDQEFVGPVLQADGLIEGNMGPYGMEITKVDGVKAVYAEDNAYWAVYDGEEYALQGIDTTPIVDGGVYKLVYTPA